MPTYEYLCGACGHQFEELQKIVDDALVTCPSCGKDTLRRLVSATAFHLKGSGWYKTDYASSGSNSQISSSNGAASSSDAVKSVGEGASAGKDTSISSPSDATSQKSTSSETKAETKAETKTPAKSSGTTD